MTIYVSRELSDFIKDTPILDIVFICFSMVVLLGVGFALYFVLVAKILPSLLLSYVPKGCTRDRGIKKFLYEGGRSVVYEPQMKFRKYVKKYVLFTYKNKKYIKLRFADGARTAVCELAVYDNRDKMIKVLSFLAERGRNGESSSFILPDDLSYARLSVIAVNGYAVRECERVRGFSAARLAVFCALTTIMTLGVGVVIRRILLFFGDLFFKYGKEVYSEGYGFAAVSSVAVGLLISFLAIWEYSDKNRFKVKRNEK